MSKYHLEINYLVLGFDISTEELQEIIEEADRVIAETAENPQKTAEAYLKKSQCLLKLGKYEESRVSIEKALSLFPDMAEAAIQLGNIHNEERNNVLRKADSFVERVNAILKSENPGIQFKEEYE
jgi:tetratricopeptide (TPR) repeat protein